MNLVKEAAYLYVYSRKIAKINRKLRRHSRKVEKHEHKQAHIKNERKRLWHQQQHFISTQRVKKLIRESELLLALLEKHHLNFKHALSQQEKSVKK